MHYYKRNIGDYHKKAGRLSILQHGAYTLLIDACYDREDFPTLDDAIDWVWASSDAEVDAVKFVLKKFFKESEGTYTQSRIQDDLEAYQANRVTNKRIAIDREKKRKETVGDVNSTKRADVVNGSSDLSNEATPNHKPLTNNQEPLTINQELKVKEKDLSPKVDVSLINDVFNYWVFIMNKGSRTSLTTLRKTKISARLKDGYPVHEIKQAIDNVAKDSFLVEGGHTDIEMICRSDTNLEKYRDASNPKAVLQSPVLVKRFFK
jgi:uncharacterized protein YdaU (DUF1376 family)